MGIREADSLRDELSAMRRVQTQLVKAGNSLVQESARRQERGEIQRARVRFQAGEPKPMTPRLC